MLAEPTAALRHVSGRSPHLAVSLVRELTGLDFPAARQLIDDNAVFLRGVGVDRARALIRRFAELGSEVELQMEAEDRFAGDPRHPLRGDQPIERLRLTREGVVRQRGRLGEWPEAIETLAIPAGRDASSVFEEHARALAERGALVCAREVELLAGLAAREPELEQAIRTHDDPSVALAVYGDWLQRQADPRGLLIATGLAAERESDPSRRAELERETLRLREHHRHQLFGPLHASLDLLTIDWRGGVMFGLGFDERVTTQTIRDALELPLATCVRALRVPDIDALASVDPATLANLRSLALTRHSARRDTTRWPALTGLRELEVRWDLHARGLELPALERLRLDVWSVQTVHESLSRARLPALRELTLGFDFDSLIQGSDDPTPEQQLRALLRLPLIEPLRGLTLLDRGTPCGTWLARALIVLGSELRGLERIDLRAMTLEPATRQQLETVRVILPALLLPEAPT
ncbi:hypothetical protein ACNOYE_23555 [Nannocystaceae bacterium ST9]